jgi:hypothetical protein
MLNLDNITSTVADTASLKTGPSDGEIEFVCPEKYYGIIPEPEPAHKHLPDWYKHLSPDLSDGGDGDVNNTELPKLNAFLQNTLWGHLTDKPSIGAGGGAGGSGSGPSVHPNQGWSNGASGNPPVVVVEVKTAELPTMVTVVLEETVVA